MHANPHTPRSRHGRIAAATMLLAASATVVGTLVVAAPAYADDYYVAVAAADDGSNIGGVAEGQTSERAATAGAETNCIAKGGSHCAVYGFTANQCMALAVPAGQWGGGAGWATGTGPTFPAAQASASAQVPGGQILAVGCGYGEKPKPGRPAPPTLPGGPPIQQP